jgi:hypothetical protein
MGRVKVVGVREKKGMARDRRRGYFRYLEGWVNTAPLFFFLPREYTYRSLRLGLGDFIPRGTFSAP